MKTLTPLIVPLMLLLTGCATTDVADTPTNQWIRHRNSLTTSQDLILASHVAGWIDDKMLVQLALPLQLSQSSSQASYMTALDDASTRGEAIMQALAMTKQRGVVSDERLNAAVAAAQTRIGMEANMGPTSQEVEALKDEINRLQKEEVERLRRALWTIADDDITLDEAREIAMKATGAAP